MWYNTKYGIARPTNSDAHSFMKQNKMHQLKNFSNSISEKWFRDNYVKYFMMTSWIKITKQATWWYRIFDFRVPQKWIAIEIDWQYHCGTIQKNKDEIHDKYHWEVSWIIVIRVQNYNDLQAINCISRICTEDNRRDRRRNMWIQTKAEKRRDIKENIVL